jgi:hypothetical protein
VVAISVGKYGRIFIVGFLQLCSPGFEIFNALGFTKED